MTAPLDPSVKRERANRRKVKSAFRRMVRELNPEQRDLLRQVLDLKEPYVITAEPEA